MFRSVPLIAALLIAAAPFASALQVQEITLTSPITNQRFLVLGVPVSHAADPGADSDFIADMGADDDGCRHSSNISEYDYYVATCPFSYFTALTVEWDDRNGRFLGDLTPEFKQWVVKEFNGDWQIGFNQIFQREQAVARAQGKQIDRQTFIMSQDDIPLYKRYKYALVCYEKRGARAAVLAKIALTGAWAMRARMNVPIADPALAGGTEEVNDKLVRNIKDGEKFSLAKWLPIYRDIFKGHISDEAYFVTGMTYVGFVLRDGDLKEAQDALGKLSERFQPEKDRSQQTKERLLGLVRMRKRDLDEYLKFLQLASTNFIRAIAEEEFTRAHLPEYVLAVAESLRRQGRLADAMDWYLCLAQMEESQPKLRQDIRAENRAPGPDAPYAVQLGWIADKHIAEITATGLIHPDVPAGANKGLLNAIIFQSFGTSAYKNPAWKARDDGNQGDCLVMIDLIGKAVLDYHARLGEWPESLDVLWDKGVIPDRNRVNRFCCPVTGQPFAFKALTGPQAAKTIVIATAKPVPTNQGPRYGAYLANDSVVWSEKPLAPGEIYVP